MDHAGLASQSQVPVDVQSKIDELFGRFKIATLMHYLFEVHRILGTAAKRPTSK